MRIQLGVRIVQLKAGADTVAKGYPLFALPVGFCAGKRLHLLLQICNFLGLGGHRLLQRLQAVVLGGNGLLQGLQGALLIGQQLALAKHRLLQIAHGLALFQRHYPADHTVHLAV